MFTELQGSPRQIGWAMRIRADKLSKWMKSPPEIFSEIESSLKKEKMASFWIAHKDDDLAEILKHIRGRAEKSKVVTGSPETPSITFVLSEDGLLRYVGELRSVTTGEIVVDPECPF